jgi:hypothetical protein
MSRAAVILLALCALCVPTVLQAQEDSLATDAAKALHDFGAGLRRSCFTGWQDSRRVLIAVAQMDSTQFFTKWETEVITDAIERTLGKDDQSFQIVPMRDRAVLQELIKALAPGAPPVGSGFQPDAVIGIEPGPPDQVSLRTVNVAAYTADRKCKHPPVTVPIGRIEDPPAQPYAFFKNAARRLDDRVERLLVMPAEVGIGLSVDNAMHQMVEGLQGQLLAAIREVYNDRIQTSVTGRAKAPRIEPYGDGAEVAGAWRARLRLDRSGRGIEVDLELKGPGGAGAFNSLGYFKLDVLPPNRQPVVRVRAAKSPFRVGDLLDVRIEALRPARLFCFIWSADGEATLLFPTTETELLRGNSLYRPTDGELKFPAQFKAFGLPIDLDPLPRPNVEFFHCIATAADRQLDDGVTKLWFENTAAQRVLDHRSASASPADTRRILAALREVDGYAEDWAKIETVTKDSGNNK